MVISEVPASGRQFKKRFCTIICIGINSTKLTQKHYRKKIMTNDILKN